MEFEFSEVFSDIGLSSIEPSIHPIFFSFTYSKISLALVMPPHFISLIFIISAQPLSQTFSRLLV